MTWPTLPEGRTTPPLGAIGWRVRHVGVSSHDVAGTAAFYERILSMSPTPSATGGASRVTEFDDGSAQVCICDHRAPLEGRSLHIDPVIRGHLSLEVEDLEAVKARLKARGEHFCEVAASADLGRRRIYCYDPAMNVVEISEVGG